MSDLQGYQHRVYSYRLDILTRLGRLRAFIVSPLFAGIDPDEQSRLQRQATLMHELSVVLQARIDFFPEVNRRMLAAKTVDFGEVSGSKLAESWGTTSSAEVRAALSQEIPLGTIGPIISTDMHPNTTGYVPDDDETISFWGKFTYEGMALQEVHVINLRKHLLHAVGSSQERPDGHIGVVAMKAGS